MLLFVRKTVLEPARNLLRRPFAAQLGRYCWPQGRVASQLATLRAQRPVPRRLVRRRRSIAIGAAVAAHLPADRRRGTIELRGDRARRRPTVSPLDISSRSIRLSAQRDRLRSAGRILPDCDNTEKIDDESCANPRQSHWRGGRLLTFYFRRAAQHAVSNLLARLVCGDHSNNVVAPYRFPPERGVPKGIRSRRTREGMIQR